MTDTTTPIVPTPMFTASIKARFWMNLGSDRTRQAIALRNQGHTYQEIADRLGYGHRMGAYWAVNNSVIAQNTRKNALQGTTSASNGSERYPESCTHGTDNAGDFSDADRRAA